MTPPLASTPSCEAVIVEVPVATAVTRPALTVAKDEAELLHFAVLVTSSLSPLTLVPLAVNCFVSPMVRKIELGVTLMLFSALPDTKKSPHPLPDRARMMTKERTAVELSFPWTALPFRIMREFYQKRPL